MPLMIRAFTYPLYERFKGLKVSRYLKNMEASQWYSSQQLMELQNKKLQKLIEYSVKNSPYYREIFQEYNIHPGDIQTIDDLPKIPYLTKSDLQVKMNRIIVRNYFKKDYLHRTSGSTGIPHNVYTDRLTESHRIAAMYRARRWWGCEPGDKKLEVWGRYEEPSLFIRIRKKILENRISLSAFEMDENTIVRYYSTIKHYRPKFIRGYVSPIYLLASYFNKYGMDLKLDNLTGINTTSEVLFNHQKEKIQKVFQCPVINEYGCSEVGLIGYQCKAGNMHLTNENIIVEFITDGRPAKSEELGDIVITDLNNRIMPLIRFKIGDLGSYSDKSCSCGRGLSLMNIAIGRETDIIVLKNGRKELPLIFEFMVEKIEIYSKYHIKEFRVIQKAIDRFIMEIIPSSEYKKNINEAVEKEFKKRFGDFGTLEFRIVEQISPEPSGKRRLFYSELDDEIKRL